MPKPTPARYRTTDWFAYYAALRKRGDMLNRSARRIDDLK